MCCQLFQPVGSHIPFCPSLGLSIILPFKPLSLMSAKHEATARSCCWLWFAQHKDGQGRGSPPLSNVQKEKNFFLKILSYPAVISQKFTFLRFLFSTEWTLQVSLIWPSWAHSSDYKHKLHPPDVQACLQGPSNQNKAGLKASVHPLWFRRWDELKGSMKASCKINMDYFNLWIMQCCCVEL